MKTELLKTINLPTAALALDATPDGKTLFAACHDGVYEVNVDSGTPTKIGQHDSYASSVALLPDGKTLISAGYDGVLQWHDLAARKAIRNVNAHNFWSWQMALSADGKLVASATGQYLAGGYKYEPAPETEPSVKVFNAQTGELLHSFSHVPPTMSVAFTPNCGFVAAANMMGEVRVWDLADGKQVAQWTTPDFTSWGIIKSHHYCGGIFALAFTTDSNELIVAGMGPMRDPMAGNGKQTWQRFAWRENPARKVGEIQTSDAGAGLMETLAFAPSQEHFVIAGRLAQGRWNVAFFEAKTGTLEHSLDTKMRVTDAKFNSDGSQMFISGATGQGKKDGKYSEYGRVLIYTVS